MKLRLEADKTLLIFLRNKPFFKGRSDIQWLFETARQIGLSGPQVNVGTLVTTKQQPVYPDVESFINVMEAVMKALGTGVRGIGWREIEVLPDRRGKPLVYLYGRAQARADKISMTTIDISLTHEDGFAIASVVGVREGGADDPKESRARLVQRLRDRGLL